MLKQNKEKESLFNALQYAIKIHINSIYGLTGSSTFIYNCKFCSQACIAKAREYLMFVHNLLNNTKLSTGIIEFNKIKNVFNKSQYINNVYETNLQFSDTIYLKVIYGDTDSTMIRITNLYKNTNISEIKNTREIKRRVYDIALKIGECLCLIINNNILNNHLNFEFESIYDRMLLFSPKKYIAKRFTPNLLLKEEVKGVSIKRRDYCKFHKKTMSDIIETIFKVLDDNFLNSGQDLQRKIDNEIVNKFNQIIVKLIYDTVQRNLNINDFVVTQKYTGVYKHANNNTELLIRNYNDNVNNIEKIERGSRFKYIYLTSYDDSINDLTHNDTPLLNREFVQDLLRGIQWKQIRTVNDYKIIINDSTSLKSNERIVIEIYINLLINEVARILHDSKDFLTEVRNLFKLK